MYPHIALLPENRNEQRRWSKAIHLIWAAMALGMVAWGPGVISLDALIARFFGDARRRDAAVAEPDR